MPRVKPGSLRATGGQRVSTLLGVCGFCLRPARGNGLPRDFSTPLGGKAGRSRGPSLLLVVAAKHHQVQAQLRVIQVLFIQHLVSPS